MKTFKEIVELVNKELTVYITSYNTPVNLYEPIRYTLEAGGKRIRAGMALLSANLFTDDLSKALPVALGLEIFHNFTLLHDDVMDNADVRRNKPTVHKMWDENTAILSGDAMQIIAYKLLASSGKETLPEVIELFSKTALQVCVGQQKDMDLENVDLHSEKPTIAEYLKMIELKTSVLIAAAFKMGAVVAGAREKHADLLYEYGKNIGIAFQLQDDYLDTFGDFKTFGKRIGGDIVGGKKTYLFFIALQNAPEKQRKELIDLYCSNDIDEEEKISAVTRIFEQNGVRDEVLSEIEFYFNKAENQLAQLDIDAGKLSEIRTLVSGLKKRSV